MGLWRQPSFLHRIQRGRARQIPPFRAGVPSTRHRRDSGRGLQPLRQRSGTRQWQYDSTAPEQNIYYWYEGRSSDYSFPDGGYLNNGSSGYTPRFWEEVVRQQFISSAAFLIEEMHVDGLRVDLTQAIHRDNTLNADGRSIGSANLFGQKFLREWSRTLHMIRPTAMLIAEDHTGWDAVTEPPAQGGLGFDATWQVAFYHNLIGDSDMAGDRARLLKRAGFGGNEPLQMDWFAGSLYDTPIQTGRLPRIARRSGQRIGHGTDHGGCSQLRSAY